MENFNFGIAKMSLIPENPLFPNAVLPKTSVYFAPSGVIACHTSTGDQVMRVVVVALLVLNTVQTREETSPKPAAFKMVSLNDIEVN